jgi:hypothetical protein
LDGGRADGKMVSTNEIMRSILNQLPDLRALQMLQVIVIRSTEIRAHRSIMARNNDAAAAGLLLLVNAVFDSETSLLHRIVQDGSVLIISDAAKEDSRIWWEKVLGSASGILSSSSGDQLGRVVVQEVFVDSEVFFLSEDGIIGFEAVFLEEGFIALSLDICGFVDVSIRH